MWGLGSYGRLGLGEVMDVPLARRTGWDRRLAGKNDIWIFRILGLVAVGSLL